MAKIPRPKLPSVPGDLSRRVAEKLNPYPKPKKPIDKKHRETRKVK